MFSGRGWRPVLLCFLMDSCNSTQSYLYAFSGLIVIDTVTFHWTWWAAGPNHIRLGEVILSLLSVSRQCDWWWRLTKINVALWLLIYRRLLLLLLLLIVSNWALQCLCLCWWYKVVSQIRNSSLYNHFNATFVLTLWILLIQTSVSVS